MLNRFSSYLAVLISASVSVGIAQNNSNTEEPISSPKRQTALTVQLFLDSEGFGPGALDGWWGEFTSKAAVRWNEANPDRTINKGPDGYPDSDSVKRLGWSKPLVTQYTITKKDATRIGSVPEKPERKADLKMLPYESLMELVAEKFHSYPELIGELNGLGPNDPLRVGQRITVPNVANPFDLDGPMKVNPSGSAEGKILVDSGKEILEYWVDGKIVHSFPITFGATGNTAPSGDWEIDVIDWMPEFRYDTQMLEKGQRSDDAHMLPPGPNNPVGIVWMGINSDGIGLHGTSDPNSIGRNTSSGCIRLSNWDAFMLGQKVAVNTRVTIR